MTEALAQLIVWGDFMSTWIDGGQIRRGFLYAVENLKDQKEILNHLNVFPVADRDTGVNMTRSMERASLSLSDSSDPSEILLKAYLCLLEYGRGNSGTILTLFFEGFSSSTPPGTLLSGRDLAYAFLEGAKTAYAAVSSPEPGTILSVASQSAQAGISILDLTDDAGLVFKRITDEAHAALLLTSYQNPILKKFQVIDSGAYGFCLILDGFLRSFAPDLPAQPYPVWSLPSQVQTTRAELPERYCTEFVLELYSDTIPPNFEQTIRSFGDYYLCVSSGQLCKVHIHTNHPEEVLQTAQLYGTLRSKKIDDMALNNKHI